MGMRYKCCRFHCWDEPKAPPPPPPPKDVGALFSLYAGTGGGPATHMDEDGLRCYLSAYQGQGQGEGTNVERLLEQARRLQEKGPRKLFTLNDFHRIVFSHDLNPAIQHQQRVHHDMTMPLSHYFIHSAHNPYYYDARPPDQGRGCSNDSIIRQLKMGVRAIEVDMWPNSKGDDIEIHHGWTTPVLLTEFLESIKKYAFFASPYPVIITLEDNLESSKLQKKAAKVLLDVLGDILYWPHTDHIDIAIIQSEGNWRFPHYYEVRVKTDSDNPLKKFPSPEELKGRVLLSTKTPSPILKKGKPNPNEVDNTIEKGDAQIQLGKGADDDDAAWGPEVPDFQTEIQSTKKHDGDVSAQQRLPKRTDGNADDDQKEQKMQPHEYPLYHHLITIRAEKQKGSPAADVLQSIRIIAKKQKGSLAADALRGILYEPLSSFLAALAADVLRSIPDEAWPSLSAKNEAIEKVGHTSWIIKQKGSLAADALQSIPDEAWPSLSAKNEAIEKAALIDALQIDPFEVRWSSKQKGSLAADVLKSIPDEAWPSLRPSLSAKNEAIEKAGLIDALQIDPDKARRLSWSNKQIQKVAEDLGTKIVRFTQTNILWINPSFSTKGYRRPTHLIPSNYNPFLGWLHGAQMVTLNLQEYGRDLWLMHGFYRANGGCGYVRKPDFLMQTEPEVFDPRGSYPVRTTLKVKVYMGDGWWMDFKHAQAQAPDFWTSVGIAGVPADTTVMKDTVATENSWIPVWGDEFSFPLTAPEIALLRVEVHRYGVSEKDVFGGQTVLPVSELQLRPGIRAVALFDRQGNRFKNVRLLMRFEFV